MGKKKKTGKKKNTLNDCRMGPTPGGESVRRSKRKKGTQDKVS